MKIAEIITILQNRLASIASAREAAVAAGDLALVALLDGEEIDTRESLAKLQG